MQPVENHEPVAPPYPKVNSLSYGPSRLSYRLQRFFLSRRWTLLWRYIIPSVLVIYIIGRLFVMGVISDQVNAIRSSVFNAFASIPIFTIDRVEVSGASPELELRLRQSLNLELPVSSLEIDLDAIRDGFAEMDEIESVTIRTPMNGVLDISIAKRQPAVVFVNNGTASVLDINGHRVEQLINRNDRLGLPVIAGIGAEKAVREAVQILRAAKPIWPNIRGVVRRGERRWDVVLISGVVIELPEFAPVKALEWAIQTDAIDQVFERRIVALDMREPARPLVRLDPRYAEQLFNQTQDEQGQQL